MKSEIWTHCASVGFFGFLSVFPVVAVFVLIYGLTLDMYPDLSVKGTIRSLSAGSGTAFSFLLPENATGN